MAPKNNIKYVTTLQTYVEPFVILYCDVDKRKLWIQVLTDVSHDTLWISADSESILRYMNNELNLQDLYTKCRPTDTDKSTELFDEINEFDPELCDDEVKARYFLRNTDRILNTIQKPSV